MSKFFNIQTDSNGVGTIFLYGDIGDYYDVQSGRVAKELMEAEKVNRRVNVRINSNGGEGQHGQRDSLVREACGNEQIRKADAAQRQRRLLRQ